MNLTESQKQLVKKLQKVILANIVNCDDDVRMNVLKRFKDIKFNVVSEIDLLERGESPTIAAYLDHPTKTVIINSAYLNKPYFEHLLLHELFHAYSLNGEDTGFFTKEHNKIVKTNKSGKQVVFEVELVKNSMMNEAATEFYATLFSDKEILSYPLFVPVYQNLSDVCGFDKLSNLYFSNNSAKMIEEIKNAYHLKDIYLIKKLFVQMDQCFDLMKGKTNNELIVEIYKTLVDMNIQKINFENEKTFASEELKWIVNLDSIIDVHSICSDEKLNIFNNIKKELKAYIENYDYKTEVDSFEKTKLMVDNFISDIFTFGKNSNYNEYKQYFKNNLVDVVRYLDQNVYYNFDGYTTNIDLPINEVLNFLKDENGRIDISHLSNQDKKVFINSILNNAKYNIKNAENYFSLADIKKDFHFN